MSDFNPLRALTGLLSTLNEGATQLKYGPNYKDKVGMLEQDRSMNLQKEQAALEHTQAQTKALDAGDTFASLAKNKVPMRPVAAGETPDVGGPGGSGWKIMTPEEQAAQAGKVATAKNTIDPSSTTDARALRINQKYDLLDRTAKNQHERDVFQSQRRREIAQMGIDAANSRFNNGIVSTPGVDAAGRPTVTQELRGNAIADIAGKGGERTSAKADVGATESRVVASHAALASEQAIHAELQKPEVRAALGAISGRITSVSQLMGTVPPELLHLKGLLHGFTLNTMGVHGMRSATEAHALMDEMFHYKFDADSLDAGAHGLNEVPRFYATPRQGARAVTGSTTGGGGAPSVGTLTPEQKAAIYSKHGIPQ